MKKLTLGVALACLLGFVGAADAAKKPTKGSILKVNQDSGKESGTITIKVAPGKKAPADATPVEKSFKITESTKLENVSGKKKDTTSTPAKFNDLSVGKTVAVAGKAKKGKGVDTVKIFSTKKKKKTKNS